MQVSWQDIHPPPQPPYLYFLPRYIMGTLTPCFGTWHTIGNVDVIPGKMGSIFVEEWTEPKHLYLDFSLTRTKNLKWDLNWVRSARVMKELNRTQRTHFQSLWSDTVQLQVVPLTLMYLKWLLCQRRSWRGQKGSSGSCSDTEHSHQPTTIPVIQMTCCGFCLEHSGRSETEENILCLALKKSTALCSEYRDIDCQSGMSLSVSPHLHILESVDISSATGAFPHFFHSVAALHLQITAFIWPAEQSVPTTLLITCSVVNYNRLIGI